MKHVIGPILPMFGIEIARFLFNAMIHIFH